MGITKNLSSNIIVLVLKKFITRFSFPELELVAQDTEIIFIFNLKIGNGDKVNSLFLK